MSIRDASEVAGSSTANAEEDSVEQGPIFPDLQVPAAPPRRTDVKVAVVLDEVSEEAFAPEWDQVPLLAGQWREQLDAHHFDLLFVESSWRGQEQTWPYRLGGSTAPRPAVKELVAEFRRRGIPTVFWNKDDPADFEDFLDSAALFDVILTTDSDCVSGYRDRLGHDRVYPLAFAAQPRIHNPVRPGKLIRDRPIAFCGTFYRDKYPERREQLEYLLPAAAEFGLDIFSRYSEDERYEFPEPLASHVRGTLPYSQVLSAYHAYKVFINVNSAVNSSTICPRRIFEISASGGAILSAPSPAISKYFPDGAIGHADNRQSASYELRALLRSSEYRDRIVHLAQRQVWEQHTYAHRVREILGYVGIKDEQPASKVSVMAPTMRPENINSILDSVSRQCEVDIELILLTHGFEGDADRIALRAKRLGISECVVVAADIEQSLGSCLNRLVHIASGDVITKMDDDDYYGDNYLRDLLHALRFSEAEIVGKAASYVHFAARDAMILLNEDKEHTFVNLVRGPTLTGPRSVFLETPFPDRRSGSDSGFLSAVRKQGGRIYAADRFNFILRRLESSAHTWQVSDQELFGRGDVKVYGDGRSHVRI